MILCFVGFKGSVPNGTLSPLSPPTSLLFNGAMLHKLVMQVSINRTLHQGHMVAAKEALMNTFLKLK